MFWTFGFGMHSARRALFAVAVLGLNWCGNTTRGALNTPVLRSFRPRLRPEWHHPSLSSRVQRLPPGAREARWHAEGLS